ncbi:hypothetical protein [Mycolicibacterium iranicum]|mgnify:CR=1 FL=1|uniref:SH3b domain-containing protein n=2 Tax=Mycolicibacterium iranicum TaxID=912594 RepID=A0ABT4HIP2_MYCIR|nr:hypothetical protein [Mycolicibacterium iranicum]MCZ0730074.1 hypothetical protein [Mycolicibacterium iranicum]
MNIMPTRKTIAAAAGLAAAAAVIGFAAPAAAAPMGGAVSTISMLEAEGNRVLIHRLSATPLDQAEVVRITRGPAVRGTVMDEFSNRTYQQTITGYVYYVSVR